ncbi:hypothetical protein RCT30_08580 [Escherichia coli]|nr:hypothetical protein [Escherichia coli]
MTIQEIPLTADNQQFSIVLGGVTWRISIIWRDLYWIMDLQNDRGEPVISGSGSVGYIACAGFSPDPVKFISRASTPGLGASFLALGC